MLVPGSAAQFQQSAAFDAILSPGDLDAVGCFGPSNFFARRAGRDPGLPAVMTDSHLDTQPTGGKFDGAYEVMAGLEVVRILNNLSYETEAPIEIVAWTNEEGSRFSPEMVGSGVFAGVFRTRRGSGKARGLPRRRTRADRLCWPRADRRKAARHLFGGAYRAGTDPRSGKEADRRRHRRPGSALVRDHGHRPGGACRADADAAAARCAGRCHAHDRRGQSNRPRPPHACATVGLSKSARIRVTPFPATSSSPSISAIPRTRC
jgi:hypothetical protein